MRKSLLVHYCGAGWSSLQRYIRTSSFRFKRVGRAMLLTVLVNTGFEFRQCLQMIALSNGEGVQTCCKCVRITTPLPARLARFCIKQMCQILTPIHFAAIFAFDIFGYNHASFYVMEDVKKEQAICTLLILAVNFVVQAGTGVLLMCLLLRNMRVDDTATLWSFMGNIVSEWRTHIVWLCACVTTIAGACMIMKPDGMDISFLSNGFEWLRD
eukprot:gnl/TRDRNA2_/TRDRNA2_159879_c0_seq1.p1 gnl/TRDRNA2_/TRDRNA2_159879_c0~~gnl/TRDRNA2_/TRDRNA2_159879_c0_seq1.p1  ORF type:complete len:212 (+),score=22.29 gnl/TRDRNA2_/TRDRNA2_159879_c0_seq1:251-886(+)